MAVRRAQMAETKTRDRYDLLRSLVDHSTTLVFLLGLYIRSIRQSSSCSDWFNMQHSVGRPKRGIGAGSSGPGMGCAHRLCD